MELETYEANLADIALQEQTFYDTKPTAYELQMASQLMNNQNNGFVQTQPGVFPLLTPIINNCGKGKKKKSVKFLTYVEGFEGEPPILLKEEPEDGPRNFHKVPSLSDLSEESLG
ncbi:CLUMA_CG008179, isoform A, partial [Clunio marinus]